ncbi:MAG: hypothetical protein ACRC0G_12170 [Fusobacteriaceae bacterium]
MQEIKGDNFNNIAASIEKHGLGIASFIILIIFLGNQIYTSDRFMDRFFDLEQTKTQQLAITNERLTKLEKLLEKAFEKIN